MPHETDWYTLVCLAHFLLDICEGSLNLKGPQFKCILEGTPHAWGVAEKHGTRQSDF